MSVYVDDEIASDFLRRPVRPLPLSRGARSIRIDSAEMAKRRKAEFRIAPGRAEPRDWTIIAAIIVGSREQRGGGGEERIPRSLA